MPAGWHSREDLVRLAMQNQGFKESILRTGIVQHDSVEQVTSLVFPQKSWRLSRPGWLAFMNTYAGYKLSNPENLFTPSMMLAVSRYARGPWYELDRTVYLWDSELNIQLAMFDGNLGEFSRFVGPK